MRASDRLARIDRRSFPVIIPLALRKLKSFAGSLSVSLQESNHSAILMKDVSYLRGQEWLLHHVSLEIKHGSTLILFGPNGSGKSSLMRILMGYWYPTKGSVYVAGHTFGRSNLHEMRRFVRLVAPSTQFDFYPYMTALDVVLTGYEGTIMLVETPDEVRVDRAHQALKKVGIDNIAHKEYGILSTGQRTRCQIARALVTEPQILLLDEPSVGLDIQSRESLLHTLQSLHGQLTLVLITHHVEDIFDPNLWVATMQEGRILHFGMAIDVIHSKNLTELFSLPIMCHYQNDRFHAHING